MKKIILCTLATAALASGCGTAVLHNNETQEAATVQAAAAPEAAVDTVRTSAAAETHAATAAQDAAALRNKAAQALSEVMNDLHFQTASDALSSQATEKLAAIAAVLSSARVGNIHVDGHADASGNEKINTGLSKRRAEAVRRVLIQNGMAASTIQTQGFSAKQPAASNETAEGRAQNRRVEIRLN